MFVTKYLAGQFSKGVVVCEGGGGFVGKTNPKQTPNPIFSIFGHPFNLSV